jgi:predicted metalloendopeptidase
VEKSISYFGAKVSHLFVEDGNGFETKAETEKMMVELRKSFNTIIEESDWMDEGTQFECLKLWRYLI